jgi:hypothetical protein
MRCRLNIQTLGRFHALHPRCLTSSCTHAAFCHSADISYIFTSNPDSIPHLLHTVGYTTGFVQHCFRTFEYRDGRQLNCRSAEASDSHQCNTSFCCLRKQRNPQIQNSNTTTVFYNSIQQWRISNHSRKHSCSNAWIADRIAYWLYALHNWARVLSTEQSKRNLRPHSGGLTNQAVQQPVAIHDR